MGFFDFLRKKKPEQEPRKELLIEEIEPKIREGEKKLYDNDLKLKERTKSLINNIISSLKRGVSSLKSVNLEKRKEDEKLKNIVKENIRIYIFRLENFIENLEKLNQKVDFNDYIDQIRDAFNGFLKNSSKNYAKATILVGAEFEAIQHDLKIFSRGFSQIVKENLEYGKKRGKLCNLSENFQKISDAENSEEQVKSFILKLDFEKKQKAEETLKNNEQMNSLKESENYKNDMNEKEKKRKEIIELEKEILMLQKKINLKELAGMFHSDEKKHKIIKSYIKNFRKAMKDDEKFELEKIVKEARGFDINLKAINGKMENLNNYASQSEINIKKIEKEAEKIKNEFDEIEKNKEAEEKKLEKLRKKKEELMGGLKSKAEEFF